MEAGPTPVFPASFRDQYAKIVIAKTHQKRVDNGQSLPDPIQSAIFKGDETDGPLHVGIIGAGAAGLYAALILDSLGSDITYEIIEADPMTNRTGGGRLYTHYFKDGGPNDYYVRIIKLDKALQLIHIKGHRCYAFPKNTFHETCLRHDIAQRIHES